MALEARTPASDFNPNAHKPAPYGSANDEVAKKEAARAKELEKEREVKPPYQDLKGIPVAPLDPEKAKELVTNAASLAGQLPGLPREAVIEEDDDAKMTVTFTKDQVANIILDRNGEIAALREALRAATAKATNDANASTPPKSTASATSPKR